MSLDPRKRAVSLSWMFVVALIVLCAILGALQYRWIGELSVAEKDRLRASLQGSLNRISQDFNSEITVALAALLPPPRNPEEKLNESTYTTRFLQWKDSGHHDSLFKSIALAVPDGPRLRLRRMDLQTGEFESAEWPESWEPMRVRLSARLTPENWQLRRPPPSDSANLGNLVEVRRFMRRPDGALGQSGRRIEAEWLLAEVNEDFLRDSLIPELLHRHLGIEGSHEYDLQIVTRANPASLIYFFHPPRADSKQVKLGNADASAYLFDVQYERIFRRPSSRDAARVRANPAEWGRWQLLARHKSGSLEAVVATTRWRNLSVTGGVFLLMIATLISLLVYSQRAQKLAELQVDFVAGVSHELCTPLTVIRTAAYNLRGRLAHNPEQVIRYGALIEQESERLSELVEQVLRFAGAKAGQAIRQPEPVSVSELIRDSVNAIHSSLQVSLEARQCQVEEHIEQGLPPIMGDGMALKYAIINLLSNAAKYGCRDGNWIGISAASTDIEGRRMVSISVADRGPGIPADERAQIFEPFVRGRRALQDQIHGTGLGLSLVKGIVEAHGGHIEMESEPGTRTVFTMKIPAAPVELFNELKNSADRG